MFRHKTVVPVVLIASWADPRRMTDASLECIHAARRSRATAGKPYKRLLSFFTETLSKTAERPSPQNMLAVGVLCYISEIDSGILPILP